MRILVVCQYFWPESFRINDICLGLIEKGYEVTVLTGIPNYPEGNFFPGYGFFKKIRQNFNGIKIIRVPMLPRWKSKGWQLVLNYLSFAFSATLLTPFVCREKYDLIFVYQLSPITMALPAIFLKRLKNLPLMMCIMDLWPESLSATGATKSRYMLGLIDKLVNFTYKSCNSILISSRGFASQVTSKVIEPSKVRYWPQWAEELYQIVKVDESQPQYGEMPKGFKVMFAGNIGAAQGFATIVDAAEKLKNYPDIHWVILGDGRMKSWVEEQINVRVLNNTFHLLGRRPVETMPVYFAFADAMLVTLKRDHIFSLTLPAKVQSYLACGRPIIAAIDGEGASTVREAGAGLTCPAEDADQLAKIVLEIYNMNAYERNKLGQNARDYFERYFKRVNLLDLLDKWMQDLVTNKSK